ncbi:MAG: indolepyruvate oxidoreductase subunit beta [Dehalococcoidia bacterium]|nr:indolepyruvate oxidoreductase subunit beta [Dehalococcoidia bacterium]
MKSRGKQDVLMVGVGGQGIILASDILGDVALDIGMDVKKTDTLGMAQRGGSVTSHLRIGEKVWSPLINTSEVDILLAFEKLEAARWVGYLRPGGAVIINNMAIPPLSISLGTQVYPEDEAVLGSFRSATKAVYLINGTEQAAALGDVRTLNIFMLGYLSRFLPLKITDEQWQKGMARHLPARILDLNKRAFEAGRGAAAGVNIR